jgi:hypothetical protein
LGFGVYMRLAIIIDGVVVNVVEVSDDWTPENSRWQPPRGTTGVLSDIGAIGDTYLNGEFIKPTPPPREIIIPQIISDRQFFQQLAVLGLITEIEALAAVRTGAIPATLQGLVDALPAEQKFSAEMLLSGAIEFHRMHPLTLMFGQALVWTAEELDALWTDASKL